MHDSEYSSRIFKAVRRIVRAIDLRSREVSRAVGLTIPQIVVLQSVREMGEVTTKQLSRQADLSPATVVMILEKLESKGLIERYRSRVDRRIVHTRLTHKGITVLSQVPPLLHDEFRDALNAKSWQQQRTLCESIETVAEMMDADQLDVASILTTVNQPG